MRNGIGPYKLGVSKQNGAAAAGKMYGAKSVAKKADAKSNKEKAAMVAEKRAAGKDSDSLRRGMKAEEFKKAGGAKISQGQPGYKEAVANAEAAAEKRLRRVNPGNMTKTPANMTKTPAKQTKNSYEKSRKKDNERIARNTARSEMEEYETNPSTRRAAGSMSNEQRRRILNLKEERVMSERRTKQMKNK